MNSFAFVVLLAAAASAVDVRSFALYGSPVSTGIRGAEVVDALPSEILGWRSVYDKPMMMAVKQEGKPEMAAFLLKDGLAGLARSADMRFLHDLLRTGSMKAGVLMGAAKYLAAPEVDMPITKVILPQGHTLAAAARMHAEHHGALPWVLVASVEDMRAAGLEKLALMGDFIVSENAVKVATDIPSPAAALIAKNAAGLSAARLSAAGLSGLSAADLSGLSAAGLSAIASPAIAARSGLIFPSADAVYPAVLRASPASPALAKFERAPITPLSAATPIIGAIRV